MRCATPGGGPRCQQVEGTGWDVGYAVRFLLSAQARYINGHVLVVDGGVTLSPPARGSHYRPAFTLDGAVPTSGREQ